MKFCQPHWDTLRVKIEEAGLSALVADSGEEVAHRMQRQLQGEESIDTYDPLMAAHWAIAGNCMEMLSDVGVSPLYVMVPMEEFPNGENECPICLLNILSYEHDVECKDPRCVKPKGQLFDDWLDKAVQGQVEYVKSLTED